MKIRSVLFALALSAAVVGSAKAGTVNFAAGNDDGSAVGLALSSYTNSFAAYQTFQTNLNTYGVEDLHGFGNASDGFHDVNFFVGGNNANPLDATLNYVATAPNFGTTFSGVNSTTNGNLYGFGVGTNNTKWVGFSGGTATFNFVNPTHAFGLWITGVQTASFSSDITISLTDADGSPFLIHPHLNATGGAEFFGLWDTSLFSSVVITDLTPGGEDNWGIDNVSFELAQTPIPATLPLFASGAGVLGLLGWRRKKRAQTAAA